MITSVSIPDNMREEIKIIAQSQHRSLSAQIVAFIAQALAQQSTHEQAN